MDIKTVRQQYPQYNDLSDEQLAEGLYKKYYSDLPRTDFYSRLGFEQAPPIDALEVTKGLKTGYELVKMTPQIMGTQMDANAIEQQQQILSAFDKIDRGEQISPTDTQMGIRDFAQVKGYQTATPEERERLRQSQMGQIKESALSLDEGLKLFEQFKKETAQYAGKTPDLTDVDSANAFADWLSYNVGAAAPQVVPMVVAAYATRGRSLPYTMGASMGVQESVSNRIDYIQDKTKDLPEDQRVDETIKYLQDTGTVSTLTGLGVGALDLFGPVGSALRRRVAQEIAKKTGKEVTEKAARTGFKGALKDVPRDVLEEGMTGAAQSLLQIGSEQYLGEQTGDVFSGENIKRIINDAAAEAAGGIAGSGVNLTTESGKSLFKKRVKSIAEKKLADMRDPADVIKETVKGKVPETPAVESTEQPTPSDETPATETDSDPDIDDTIPAQDEQAMQDEVREMQGLPPEDRPAVTPTSTQLPLTEDQPSADITTPPEPVGIRTTEELRRQARSLGIDPDAILNEISLREDLTQEQFDQEYESTIRQEISRRLAQADSQQVGQPETSALPQEGSQTTDTIPTSTTPPPTVGYRPQSEAEKSMFGTSKVVDFGVGNAQINFDSDTIFLSRPDGSRRGGPSDDAIIRPGDNRRNVIKRPEDFPDYVPDAARQPLIDYANIMAEQRKRFPNTREGRQELQSVMESLPVTKRLNTALASLSPQQVGQPAPTAQTIPEGAVLQNRERSSPSSVQQMNSIANDPDYSRVGFSNSFLEGAPVVFGDSSVVQVPSSQLGRTGQISSGKTKRKVPVQYAVIEASQAIPSNNVDGATLEQYADPAFPGFKAVTNGRLAGLQEGYRRQTMEKYKQDLMADDIHGIDPSVIGAMQNPLLVRIMPQSLVTKDIADESNTASTLALSATEKAKNDANRIDLDGLQFKDDGGISFETVRGFVASMPQTEQQELMDKDGRPTRQAYDRLNAAIFSKAYQNDALINLAAQAEDAEAKNIISALSQAAPQMAVLPQGDYDVRPAVLEATELAINARRQGQKLTDLIDQQDLVSQNPVSRQVMQLYANNPRSAKKIGEGLRRIADAANAEASKSLEPDMFGDIPERRPLEAVVSEALASPQSESDLFAEAVAEVRISPEQQKAEALDKFQRVLGQVVPPHRARYANGRIYTIRPKAFTEKQTNLMLDLAGSAIDLGMPAVLLEKITATGSTGSESLASMANPRGYFTIGKQWASASKAEQLETLIHEIGHAADYNADREPVLSGSDAWTSAHTELKEWYTSQPTKHPLEYPFEPQFAKKVRIRQESFAQAFALYFTSPVDLQNNAPQTYAQLDAIIKGIQNESRPAQTTGAQKRGIAEVDVQQARAERSAAVQPQASAVSPSLSPAPRSRDRDDQVTVRDSSQEGSQDIPLRDIVPPQTEEFNTWFGDSKVVDLNQNPVLVYHGTNQDVNEFTTQPNALRPRFYAGEIGSWFGDNPKVANNFARGLSSPREGGAVYPAYLSIKNPKVYNSYQEFLSAAKGRRSAPAMRRDLIKQGYDGIHIKDSDTDFGGRRDDWVAFHPEQIKSAFNLRPTSDPSIIRDVQPTYRVTGEVNNAADLEALNADIRAAKISEYQSVKRRLSEVQRRRVRNEARRFDDESERSLYETAETLKAEIEMSQPERRTPEDFMARAAKALADGDISKDVYDVIDAMFKKNPALLNGLQLSVRAGRGRSAGQFIPLIRMVKLFKGYGAYNPSTVRHEVTHSMEQMMSPEARAKVIDEWRKAVAKAKKANQSEQAKKFFQAVENFIANPSADNYNATIETLPSYEYYQFVNPSEYWAVNAEKLMQSYLGSGWQRFKSSMKGFLEAIKKVLGLQNTHAIYSTFNDLITKPRGRESTTMLVGYINENVPIMDTKRRNYAGNPAPPATFESPPGLTSQGVLGPTTKTNFRYNFQDKMIDLKDTQKAIEKTAKTIDDFSDAYTKETLYYGRTANQSKEFLTKEVKPVLSKMQKFKVTPEELSAYLLAKHAPERNAYIATINPSFPDGGAGITTAEANAYLDTLSPERRQQLESLGDDMRSIILGTHDIEVKGGLEEQALIDGWRAMWPDYVPLFRSEIDYVNSGSGMGQGIDTRGASSKRAVGSSRDIKDIFSSIIEQRERAIVRAEKNRIGQGLYALSIQNPNADWWLPINPDAVKSKGALIEELDKLGISPQEAENLMSPPKVATVVRVPLPDGSYHNQVQYRVSSNANFSDNVVGLRVNGKNRYVIFNPNNERAKRLASSLKNLDAEQLDFLNQRIGNVTRFIASMSTQYNPLFGAWNFYRDWQSAALNLTTTPLKGKQAVIVFDAFKMIPKMYQEYRATRGGRDAQGEVPTLLREFLTEGAQSGYREQFEKLTARGTIVERELAKLNAGNVKTVVNSVAGWLSDYNDVLENAIRLSAYKQAKKMNMTNQQAARLAKEITVNFNRKGAKTPGLSALYAFFNAAVQGTDRMIDTLTGPAGKKIVAGGLLLGVVQALVLEAMGFEEDEPTDFIKQKNLIIPIGGGDYLMWPMPLGFNFLPNVGRILTEMTLGGKAKARDRVAELLAVMVDSFNPLGGAGFLQTLSPTVLDPFIAVSENKDAFGRPVSREDFATNPKPGYLRSRQNATEFSKLFAEALNSISGGTKYTPGLVSPTGDDLDYIVGQYLGGVGREVQRMYELGKSQVTGEELETYRIPLFGKLYGKTDSPAATAARFYSTVTRMAEHEQEIKGRRDEGRDPRRYIAENPEARLYKYTNNMENKISKLNTRIRKLQETDPRDPRVEKLQERKTILMQLYLDRVKELFPN